MDEFQLLAALLAALAVNELLHILFEVWGIRQKVSWLQARMDNKPHGDWPININNLTKTLTLHAALFLLITCVTFATFIILDVSSRTLLQISIGLLIVTYAYTVFGMDAFHSEIGHLLKRYKRR
jgi:hypothetical protein